MGYNFPNSPTVGQVFAPSGGPVYTWNGTSWSGSGWQGQTAIVSDTPPASPGNGALWYESDTGVLFTYVNDGTSSQWVQVGGVTAVQAGTAEVRNRIVNGAMQISQELGVGGTSTTGAYVADQWPYYFVGPAVTATKLTGVAISSNGNPNRITMTVSTAKPSLAAGDFVQYYQPIEGIRISDWQWGTARAKQLVLRFTTQVHVAGNYTVCLRNGAVNRSWLGSFNIPAAGVDTTITMVIPGDTTGTWPTDNTNGATLVFSYAVGSTYLGVAGWQSGDKRGITGMANAASITGALGLTDVGLYLDPNATGTPPPWQTPDEAQELEACRRYWLNGGITAHALYWAWLSFSTVMRAAPSVATTPAFSNAAGQPTGISYQHGSTVAGSFVASARM